MTQINNPRCTKPLMNRAALFRHLTLITCTALSGSALSAQDLLSLPLEELLQIEVIPRQPYRGNVPLKALPQTVEIITDKFVAAWGISTFQDSLDFASNVVRQNSFGNTWDSFAIRGFAGEENLPGGYFVNGFSAGRGFGGVRDISNIQDIEVLKGAGAAFYGRSEPGGTINIVTKKPKFAADGYIQASMANENTRRLEGDYTSAATTNLALRINGAYEQGDSFRDTIETQKLSLNPSLLFRLSEHAHATYEIELLDQEIPFDRGIVVANKNVNSVAINRFYGEPDDGPMEISAIGHQFSYEQNIGEQWHILSGLGYRDSSLEGYSTEPELSMSRQLFFTDGTTLNRQRRYRDFEATDISARIELSGELTLGGLTNNLLLGIDNYQYELTQRQNVWRVTPGDTTYSVNWQTPVYGQSPPELQPFWDLQEQNHGTGAYIQNQLELSPRWKLLAGFRYDNLHRDVNNFLANSAIHQLHNKTTPRFGALYEISKFASIYVNYSKGFRPTSGSNWAGDAFQPEQSRSYEMGAHFTSPENKFNGSIAFFNAGKTNILTADPIHVGYSSTLGEAESQGVELNIDAALDNSIDLSFAYAFIDAHTTKNMTNPDWGMKIAKNNRLINIPKHKATFTVRRHFTLGQHHSNLGLAFTYVGHRLGETGASDYILPSYTAARLFNSVDINDRFQLNLVIDNLFNEKYFVNSYSALWTQPGSPRTIRLALRHRF